MSFEVGDVGATAKQCAEEVPKFADGRVKTIVRWRIKDSPVDGPHGACGHLSRHALRSNAAEQLRHSARAIHGVCSRRDLGLRPGETKSSGPNDLLIVDQGDRDRKSVV